MLENDTIQLQTTVAMSSPDSSEAVGGTLGFSVGHVTTIRMRDEQFCHFGHVNRRDGEYHSRGQFLGSLPV